MLKQKPNHFIVQSLLQHPLEASDWYEKCKNVQ